MRTGWGKIPVFDLRPPRLLKLGLSFFQERRHTFLLIAGSKQLVEHAPFIVKPLGEAYFFGPHHRFPHKPDSRSRIAGNLRQNPSRSR